MSPDQKQKLIEVKNAIGNAEQMFPAFSSEYKKLIECEKIIEEMLGI